MTRDLLVSVAVALICTGGAWLVARWLLRLAVPLSPAQERRRPVIERWFFTCAFVLCFAAALWGQRS